MSTNICILQRAGNSWKVFSRLFPTLVTYFSVLCIICLNRDDPCDDLVRNSTLQCSALWALFFRREWKYQPSSAAHRIEHLVPHSQQHQELQGCSWKKKRLRGKWHDITCQIHSLNCFKLFWLNPFIQSWSGVNQCSLFRFQRFSFYAIAAIGRGFWGISCSAGTLQSNTKFCAFKAG